MKKIGILFLYALILFSFVSCSTIKGLFNKEEETEAPNENIIEILDIEYGYIEKNDSSVVDFDNYEKLSSIYTGEEYYMVFEITAVGRSDNEEEPLFTINFQSPNLDGRTQRAVETSSGTAKDMPFRDSSDGSTGITTAVSVIMPEGDGTEQKYQVIFEVSSNEVGYSNIFVGFESNDTEFKGVYKAGKTLSIEVDANQILAPTLEADELGGGKIIWNHVKNADYYIIYVNNQILEVNGENVIVEVDEFTSEGSEISYFLSLIGLTGTHKIKIKAVSFNAQSFPRSNYSNEIEITL